jgi:hypothetical protein
MNSANATNRLLGQERVEGQRARHAEHHRTRQPGVRDDERGADAASHL